MTKTYVLFAAQHEVPQNDGALCSDFDFVNFSVVKTENWEAALKFLHKSDSEVKIIVTGLTPALTEFITAAVKKCNYGEVVDTNYCDVYQLGRLVLLHWDKSNNDYREQVIWG